MENIDKKKLANEKRLKAIKEWKKIRTNGPQKISLKNIDKTVLKYDEQQNNTLGDKYEKNDKPVKNQLKLFDSDAEEDFSDCFKIRPQFEGKNGLQMLELNSELSERFKLDERFREKETEIQEDVEDPEKNKNIKILESILGHEVCKKHPVDVNARKKRELKRFDPENEGTENHVKPEPKIQKKLRKKEKRNEQSISEEIPYTSERYIEVVPDLKNIISSATPFSFSEKFNIDNESKDNANQEDIETQNTGSLFENTPFQSPTMELKINKESSSYLKNDFDSRTSIMDPFFISSTDERLKDGINFFVRPHPLDEIREQWLMKREEVLEIFKRRKKSTQRRSLKKPKKQNQKRSILF